MPYPTPPPEPPSIIQTVPLPESPASPSVGEALALQKVAKQPHQPDVSSYGESEIAVSSSAEAIAATVLPEAPSTSPINQALSSPLRSESSVEPTSVTQEIEPEPSEPEYISLPSLAPVSLPESIPLAVVPQFATPETPSLHPTSTPESTDASPSEASALDSPRLNAEPATAATLVINSPRPELAAIPLSSQWPPPPLLPTTLPSLNSVSATRETGLHPFELEPVDIFAPDLSQKTADKRANAQTDTANSASLPSWATPSSQSSSLLQGGSRAPSVPSSQIAPLQLQRVRSLASLRSESSRFPVSVTLNQEEPFSPFQLDAVERPDFPAPDPNISFPSSSPIPPLSQVIELPPLVSETLLATTPAAPDNSPQPTAVNLTDVASVLPSAAPASTPIPPLSQVIQLPPLPGEYSTTPIPVTQDIGLQVSSSERTEASFLSEETSSSLSGYTSLSGRKNSIAVVPTTSAMARLQADEQTHVWGVLLAEAIVTDITLQAQIVEPDSVDPDIDPEPDASDRPIPNDELNNSPDGELGDDLDDELDIPERDNEASDELDNESLEDESSDDEPDGESSDDLDDELDTEDADTEDADTEDSDDEAASQFPRAASPEPFWHNGAVTNDGILLTPSEPTNQPAAPLRLAADYQEFEPLRQVVTARGDVVLQLGNGVLAADRLWANLFNRYVLVDGNVVFRQGEQFIEGERGEYNLLQGQGSLFEASGTLFIPDIGDDFATITSGEDAEPVSAEDVRREDPITGVIPTGGITFGTGNAGGVAATAGGDGIRRVRFEAAQVDFDAEGWVARDVRLTNDPFSPPELEIRGDTATLTPLNELEDELVIENPRLVFDQGFSLPLLRSRYVFRRGDDAANPLAFGIGFDGEDRGGLFIERSVTVATTPRWDFRVTPQLLVQRLAREDDEGVFASNFGLVADLNGQLNPTTTLRATADFSGLDLDNFENRLRASVRLRQQLGQHTLNWEYSYRDRLFNGSLGFQNVQSSLGAVLVSPSYVLGDTGIVLNYQVGAQYITALTDRDDLLQPFETQELVSLGRFQGNVSLLKVFTLWRGRPLPRTPDQGLRFTPNVVVPNIQLILRGQGTYSYYTSSDTQESLSASIGITGQLGHFSRDFLDSTTFNLTYRRSFVGDSSSPFLFDRDVDRNRLSAGILQQIYGPIRVGFQTDINLDTGEVISTDYIVEYSRRTYGVVLRVNPERRTGFIGLRITDFGWSGRAAAFGGADVDEVEGGVVREQGTENRE